MRLFVTNCIFDVPAPDSPASSILDFSRLIKEVGDRDVSVVIRDEVFRKRAEVDWYTAAAVRTAAASEIRLGPCVDCGFMVRYLHDGRIEPHDRYEDERLALEVMGS